MKTQRTDQKRTARWLSTVLLFGAILTLIVPAGAWAAGTAAGTRINNRATINYQVNSTAQDPVYSQGNDGSTGQTFFLVDNKVDLTVVSQGDQLVSTNQAGAALEFLVTNNGNGTQGYHFEYVAGTTDIAMSNIEIRIENGANAGFQDAEDTPYDSANPPQLDADEQITVYIVADAPASAANSDTDTYWLRATTLDPGTTDVTTNTGDVGGADRIDKEDNVLADADADGAGSVDDEHDGGHADSAVFTVSASNLTVTKTSVVVEDPVNGTTNPKAIPGAFVEYKITIANGTGAAKATGVVFSDDLANEINTLGTLAFKTDSYSGNGIIVTAPDIGTDVSLTNGADGDAGDYGDTAPYTVTVNCGDLDAGESATVKFQVEVQ